METKVDFNVLECLEKIHIISKDCILSNAFFEENSDDIAKISSYLSVTAAEAVLFANAFLLWFEDATFREVFKYFGLKEFQILKYRTEIESLYNKNILSRDEIRRDRIIKYNVPQSMINLVSKNLPLKNENLEIKKVVRNVLIDVLEEFDNKKDEYDLGFIKIFELNAYISQICSENLQLPLFSKIRNLDLSPFETFFLLDSIWNAVRFGDNDFNTNVQQITDDYYKRKSESVVAFNEIIQGKSKLTKLDLIELSKGQFVRKTLAKLSSKMIKFLSEKEGIKLDNFSQDNRKLMPFDAIKSKELFYNDKEITQIKIIENALHQNKFQELQQNLSKRNLPKGIAILFHGSPGTGKTETVYQLAKITQRNIYKVDISETKSMWFGESQKIIKKVFTDYQMMKETEQNCPILLFNEADGIISKRKPVGMSNTAETENAIQNIILEELENLEGIFFATTNLMNNLDDAFERRFLFKVKFEIPEIETCAKIWKSKFCFLSQNESFRLAKQFPFSGGEIDNIARKSLMNELLNNTPTTFLDIVQFCRQEKWDNYEDKKIGF